MTLPAHLGDVPDTRRSGTVSAVTSCTIGGLAVVPLEQPLAVNASFIFIDDVGLETIRLHHLRVGVAIAASFRDVLVVNRTLGIIAREYSMSAVTVGAYRHVLVALHPFLSVHGSAVKRELIRGYPVRFHLNL